MKKTRASSYANGKKAQVNRRNPVTAYWMHEEIFAHDCRLVFPDWSLLAHRGMESRKRDNKAHYQKYRNRAIAQKKEYRQRPEVKAAHALRTKRKQTKEPHHRMRRNLSRRLCAIMNGGKASRNITDFIGCSEQRLRQHIESQFKPWMNWGNYGTEWHVDHIVPVSAFDHADIKQVKTCWNWANLRPLKAEENTAKKDRITHPQMPLTLIFD